MEGTQKPVLYVHMRIRLSGHEKNHKPTCKECVRHHPKKNVPHCSFVYLCICAPAKEITALRL